MWVELTQPGFEPGMAGWETLMVGFREKVFMLGSIEPPLIESLSKRGNYRSQPRRWNIINWLNVSGQFYTRVAQVIYEVITLLSIILNPIQYKHKIIIAT